MSLTVTHRLRLISQVNTASTYGSSEYGDAAVSHIIATILPGYPPHQRAVPLHGSRGHRGDSLIIYSQLTVCTAKARSFLHVWSHRWKMLFSLADCIAGSQSTSEMTKVDNAVPSKVG